MKKQCGILAILISLFIVSSGCKKTDEVKTGALQVSVVNQSSLPIRDAMVTLTGFSQVQYSSSEGLVLFSGLDISVAYHIRVIKANYDTIEVQGITLIEGTQMNQSVILTTHPLLGLSQNAFDFDSTKNQLPLIITNPGTGTLNWEFRFGNVTWITADPASGSVTDGETLVFLNINRNALPQGSNEKTVYLQYNGGVAEVVIKAYGPIPAAEDTLVDVDGNRYGTIKIGDQVWMKENLRVTHDPDGNAITSYYFNNDPYFLQLYGRLYSWPVSMDNVTYEMAQGICPNGWHIPSNTEVNILVQELGGVQVAGGKLKSTGTDLWLPPNSGATNSSGFTALPAGDRWYDGTFHYLGERAFFWNSTIYNSEMAYLSYVRNDSSNVGMKEVLMGNGMPVRCIKNQ